MIWDAIDSVGYLLDQARRQSAVLRWRLAGHIEHRRTRRYECSLPPLFDAVLVSSARDRDEIGGRRQCAPTSGRVCILPNGVDTSTFVPSNGNQAGSRAGTPIVTLSGALDYHPNVTAAIRLAERIMPLVWIDRPEIRLRIVGAAPGRRLLGMGGSANGRVEVLGDVVDIAEQLRIASAVAAPLSYGAGTQFKILEALSCGAPTVTSTQVARRLGATPGRHLLAEDDDHDIVRSIIRLTDDTDYGRRLGQAGRAFVEQNFGWEGIVGRLEDIYVESVDALRVGVAEPSRSFASVGVG
jgi:glycosyltransferase involved in cell wall biosynthesis